MTSPTTILLVGYGKMGSAMEGAWRSNPDYAITIVDPSLGKNLPDTKKPFDIIVLAVKPQNVDEACAELVRSGLKSSLILSILAGKPLKFFEDRFGGQQAVIRAMPNTPALVQKGITVAVANGKVATAHKTLAEDLLYMMGKFEWISDESLMDAVTALSGSGPAYVFLLIEDMAKAGIAQGLAPDLAWKLARQTVIGASALAAARPEIPADVLRKNVTSPGGTTEAALKVLMSGDGGLSGLMTKAVAAATQRGRELSGS